MGKDFYNDNNFEKLTEDLQNLPKIQAPSDFEFKLMARIQNKNFESKFMEEKEFTFGKFLKPAFSLAVVMLIFIVFLNIQDDQVNPPLIDTPVKLNKINSGSLNEVKNIEKNKKEGNFFQPEINDNKLQKSDVAVKSNKNIQFPGKTIDIDNAIKQNRNTNQQNEFGVLAGSEEFSGFGVRVPARKGEIDSIRSKIDSIRNASKK
jgi:hypothetical protein